MIPGRQSWSGCALWALLLLPGLLAGAPAAEHLTWRKDKNSIDADITSWDLLKTLEHISEATGWQVYVQPGAKRAVSTKFKDSPAERALDLLLGDLGRVLLPGTNGGPSRLLVFRTSEKDATQLVRRRRAKPIPDQLIVTMKAGKSIDELAKKLGAKVIGKSSGMKSGLLKFESEEAAKAAREALRDNEDVASTDSNYPVDSTPAPEGTGATATPNLKVQPVKEGDALIIGLIDTHVGSLGPQYDQFLLNGISVAGEPAAETDRLGHGPAMALTIISGMSAAGDNNSRVRILPVDVYGPNSTTTTYDVARGIFEAMQRGAQIINMSLGSDADSPFLYDVIRSGTEAGRIFVGSAGNVPVTTPTFPAAYPEVIAVTAGAAPGQLAPYANRGAFVDMMAPGTSVVPYNGQAWRVNGTSPAAAYVSGAIAGTADSRGGSLGQAAASVQRSLPPPALTAP